MENLSQTTVELKRTSFFTFSRKIAVVNLFILVLILIYRDQLIGISFNLFHFVAWAFMYAVLYQFKPRDRFDSYFFWPLLYPLLILSAYFLFISNNSLEDHTGSKLLGTLIGMIYMSIVRYFVLKKSDIKKA